MSASTNLRSSADAVEWSLAELYSGLDDPKLEADLAAALVRAQAFEKEHRGRINTPTGPRPESLLAALEELEGLSEQMDKSAVFAMLAHSAKTDDPKRGALLSRTREARTAINRHLIFFDLEWVALADEPAKRLIADPKLARYRHWLEQKRAWKPHYLSEPEEKVLEEKAVTGRAAFVRLFDETAAALTCTVETAGEQKRLPLQQTLARLYDPDRGVRQAAAAGITAALKEQSRLLTYLFNTLVLDHQTDTRLRGFPDFMASRHLANEITAPVVEALMASVEAFFPTVRRYYRLKAKLLGLPELFDYDRYAPISGDLPRCDWPTARNIVVESYAKFSPEAGAIVGRFFTERWIDAAPRPGKRGGAFSSSGVPSVHPYILMSYTDKLRDVMTLAHELGHGLHQYLSRGVGYLQCDTPLTTAETASVFGEMLTFERLLELHPEPKTRLALLCSKLEDSFATAFRQIVLTRFEQKAHAARKTEGELTTDRLNELWMEANAPMHEGAVTLTEGYGWWWLYIGHFVHVPFYCYAYAFGELLVLALVQRHKQEGPAFVKKYLALLESGGSEAPPALLKKLGVDIEDPAFWRLGLTLLDGMVKEAETLASQA